MPCSYPLQAYFRSLDYSTGEMVKHSPVISSSLRQKFFRGESMPCGVQGLPCGRCVFCKLERSRQTAVRCVHESKLYDDNCFVTLTFDDEHLAKLCPVVEGKFSLVRKPYQDFLKRLRQKFSDRVVRVFGCGEYGECCEVCGLSRKFCRCLTFIRDLGRPHFHFCFFNLDFRDRVFFKSINGFNHYNSSVLSDLWSIDGASIGHATVTDFSFDTAAYVARYCTKKITGDKAEGHYRGRMPEFSIFPNRGGGIGKPWFDKFGCSDIFPHDSVVSEGILSKVPRYYDKLRERVDPEGLLKAKELRAQRADAKAEDNTYARLLTKEKCMNARIRLLVRSMEI